MIKYEYAIFLLQIVFWLASLGATFLTLAYGAEIVHMILGGKFANPNLEDITSQMRNNLIKVILQIAALIGAAWYAYNQIPR